MLRDTDDRLLCPECGGELWVGVCQIFYGPAYYDIRCNDRLDWATATDGRAVETTATGLWCQKCRWMTREVDEYLRETQDDPE